MVSWSWKGLKQCENERPDQANENRKAVYSGLSFGRDSQQAEEWQSKTAKMWN